MNEQEIEKMNRYQKALDRVNEIKGFYIHLICYLLGIPFLIYINYSTYWDFQWFWFPLLGWGAGLTAHGLGIFGMGRKWEERKIRKLMEEDDLQ
jgi:hypothetical protein